MELTGQHWDRTLLSFLPAVLFASFLLPAAGAGEMAAPELIGTVWSWRQTQMNNDEQFVPARPGDYTLRLEADGTLVVRADCNQSRGTYTISDNRITIEPGPTTLAACPEGSLGDRFIRDLDRSQWLLFRR